MKVIRKHKGRPDGEPIHVGLSAICPECGEEETWTIYDRGPAEDALTVDRWKLCADEPVCGRANYWLQRKNSGPSLSGDMTKLRQDRPDLHAALGQLVAGGAPAGDTMPAQPEDERDPYGDLVDTSKHPHTKMQKWRRGILTQRLTYVSAIAKGRPQSLEVIRDDAIPGRYEGIFKAECPPEEIEKQFAYVTSGHTASVEAIQRVLDDYYGDKYLPYDMQNLALWLDFITGVSDEEPRMKTSISYDAAPAVEAVMPDEVGEDDGTEEIDFSDLL